MGSVSHLPVVTGPLAGHIKAEEFMDSNDLPKLVIRYKEDQARNALFLAIALAPVW